MKTRLDLICFLALAIESEARAERWEREERARHVVRSRGTNAGLWDAMHLLARWRWRAGIALKARDTFGRTPSGIPRTRRKGFERSELNEPARQRRADGEVRDA
jgi:hypothetical protein